MIGTVKKKKVSKKNKASWRKHADIKDVEEFLDEQRKEERIGRVTDKPDEELFVDDRKQGKVLLSEKEKRKETAKKKLNSLTALENTSKVEDPIVKRNYVKQKRVGRNILEEIAHPSPSKRVQQSNQDRLKFYENKAERLYKKYNDKSVKKDLWIENDVLDKHPEFKNRWFSKTLVEYHLRNTGNPVVKVRKTVQKKLGKIGSKDLPHPGQSYNPTLDDHQKLLERIVENEEDIIKKEKHLKRVTTDMFKKVTKEERDNEIVKELTAEEPTDSVEIKEEKEDEDDSKPYNTTNPPVQNKKKDKKARRKAREQRELQQERQKKKLVKKQVTDLHRVRAITAEVLTEEQQLNQIKKKRKVALSKKMLEPQRLGKLKYEEPDAALNLPEELSGDLRSMKPDHSLLLDRYKSLQRRNIVVPTSYKGLRKKPKRKTFIRKTHKEEPVQKVGK